MTRPVTRFRTLVTLLCATLLFGIIDGQTSVGQASQATASEEALSAEDLAARATFEMVCSACHETERATTTLRTPVEWSQILDDMAAFGANATDAQFLQIQRYLNHRYGKVNLNRATAAELELVLNVSGDVARAILDYRSMTRITSADDLKNVTGFPVARIDALKPHLQF